MEKYPFFLPANNINISSQRDYYHCPARDRSLEAALEAVSRFLKFLRVRSLSNGRGKWRLSRFEVATSRPGKHEFAINENVIIRVHCLGSPGGDRLARVPFHLGKPLDYGLAIRRC